MLSVKRFDDVEAFRAQIFPFILEQEEQNCLIFGDIADFQNNMFGPANPSSGLPYFAVVSQSGSASQSLLVAIQTTDFRPLLVAELTNDQPLLDLAIEAVIQDRASASSCQVQHISGTPPTSSKACAAWTRRHPTYSSNLEMNQCVYAIEAKHVTPHPAPQGARIRFATPEDVPLLMTWTQDFLTEIGLHRQPVTQDPLLHACAASRAFLLCTTTEEPACLVLARGDTPNGVRLSMVYTPPLHRGQGYAPALVSYAVSHLATSGKSKVFLFADKAYPPSNSVYRRVGFHVKSDFELWKIQLAVDS